MGHLGRRVEGGLGCLLIRRPLDGNGEIGFGGRVERDDFRSKIMSEPKERRLDADVWLLLGRYLDPIVEI